MIFIWSRKCELLLAVLRHIDVIRGCVNLSAVHRCQHPVNAHLLELNLQSQAFCRFTNDFNLVARQLSEPDRYHDKKWDKAYLM